LSRYERFVLSAGGAYRNCAGQEVPMSSPYGGEASGSRSSASAETDTASVRIRPMGGLRVVGEVDVAVHQKWSDMLTLLAGEGGDIHLDMSELTFIDGRATAELVELARTLPAGRTITLCRPPRVMLRVMNVMWSQAPLPVRVLS